MTWFFRCIPLKKTWNPSIEGSCYGIDLFITFALVNTGKISPECDSIWHL